MRLHHLFSALAAVSCAPVDDVACGSPDDVIYNVDDLDGCTLYRGSIHISDSGLTDLTGFPPLRVVEGSLTFFRNEQLTTLHGLEGLESVRRLGFNHNEALTDTSALSSLRTLTDELYFISNGALVTLAGLEGVRATGTLEVIGNDRLQDLDGLSRLRSLTGDLTITVNQALPQAHAEAFAAGLDVAGSVEVADNGP